MEFLQKLRIEQAFISCRGLVFYVILMVSVIGLSWVVARFLSFFKKGRRWCLMTVFESLIIMLTFGALIVSILSERKITTLKPGKRSGDYFHLYSRVAPLKGCYARPFHVTAWGGLYYVMTLYL